MNNFQKMPTIQLYNYISYLTSFCFFSLEFLGSSSDFPVGLDDAIDLHIPILLKGSSQGLEILRAKVQDPEQGLDVAVLDSAKRYLPRFQGNKGHLSRMKHKKRIIRQVGHSWTISSLHMIGFWMFLDVFGVYCIIVIYICFSGYHCCDFGGHTGIPNFQIQPGVF